MPALLPLTSTACVRSEPERHPVTANGLPASAAAAERTLDAVLHALQKHVRSLQPMRSPCNTACNTGPRRRHSAHRPIDCIRQVHADDLSEAGSAEPDATPDQAADDLMTPSADAASAADAGGRAAAVNTELREKVAALQEEVDHLRKTAATVALEKTVARLQAEADRLVAAARRTTAVGATTHAAPAPKTNEFDAARVKRLKEMIRYFLDRQRSQIMPETERTPSPTPNPTREPTDVRTGLPY